MDQGGPCRETFRGDGRKRFQATLQGTKYWKDKDLNRGRMVRRPVRWFEGNEWGALRSKAPHRLDPGAAPAWEDQPDQLPGLPLERPVRPI